MNPSAPLLAKLVELSYSDSGKPFLELARRLSIEVLFKNIRITCNLIRRYIWKAIRINIWRKLMPEARALLWALSRWRKTIKSLTLQETVAKILLEIELNTTKGKAVLYGIVVALSRGQNLLNNMHRNITNILILGLQYTNLPPIYRVFG